MCAGRTDTGVHARGQVVHVDLAGRVDDQLLRRLNGVLPADVRVRRVAVAPDGFDARFSAVWRRYAYRVADAPALVDPLTRQPRPRLATRARPRRDERRVRPPARAPGLRRVLQAA